MINDYFYIDDILKELIDLKTSGHNYCEIALSYPDENDIEIQGGLHISGLECGGLGACDCESIDRVPDNEILEYADFGIEPPNHRIKYKIEID